MPLVYYVPEYERDASQTPLDAERLLRLLGVSGKLTGFRYAVYMVEQVRDQPENMILITKRLYAQTAAHFQTTPSCVERNLRTLIQSCWNYPDDQFPVYRHSGRLPAKLTDREKGGAAAFLFCLSPEMWLNLRQISTLPPFGTNVSATVHLCGLATVRELNRSIGYIRYAPERKAVRD